MRYRYKELPVKVLLDGENNDVEIRRFVDQYEADGWKYIGAIPKGAQSKTGKQEIVLMFRKVRD